MDSQFPNFNIEGPGDVDAIIATKLMNPYRNKIVTIISGEFADLNGKQIIPGNSINLSLVIPQGFREYIKPTSFNGNPYIYIGLRDKDAAEPLIHKPNI